MSQNNYAILMAGGIGSRFWPSSKASNPKQFLDILGVGETLFQTTFKRLSKLIPEDNILILTNAKYIHFIKDQVPAIKDEQIVAEPAMRNTAPSILLGALKIHKKDPKARIVVAPSDHWMKEQDRFLNSLEEAFDFVSSNEGIVTLGVEPTYPNTGYGYIEYQESDKSTVKSVLKFKEKPSLKKANSFIEAGNYVWNAGIFISTSEFLVSSFKEFQPEMYRLFHKGEDILNTADEEQFLEENYANASSISVDYAIMEKTDKAFVIPVDFPWNDLGTWTAVQGELAEDENQNTCINSRLIAGESENNIISTSGKIVVLKGLSDFIIVEDKDILMIVKKSEEQSIKEIREKVMEEYGKDLG